MSPINNHCGLGFLLAFASINHLDTKITIEFILATRDRTNHFSWGCLFGVLNGGRHQGKPNFIF